MDQFGRAVAVIPPLRRPDPNDIPAKIAQDLFADFVSITGGCGAVVGGPIAFDAGEVSAGSIGVDNAEVHAEAGDTDLRNDIPATLLQAFSDGLFEGGFKAADGTSVGGGQRNSSAISVIEKGFQMDDTDVADTIDAEFFGFEGGIDDEFATCAGDSHIEPSVSAFAVEWPEVECHRPGLIGSEGDGEQHHIAFVALDIFEVLDDCWFNALFAEIPFDCRLFPACLIQQVFDQGLLGEIEGDDAQCGALIFGEQESGQHALGDIGHNCVGFFPVGTTFAAIEEAIREILQGDSAVLSDGGGKGDQLVVVVVPVGEGDEGFVAAAVVPVQLQCGQARCASFVEDTFEILFVILKLFVLGVGIVATEEICGWKLFGVTDDYGLAAACDGTDGIPGGDL